MTEVLQRKLSDEQDHSPGKCRERRRRRIIMRRFGATSSAGSEPPASRSRREDRAEDSDCVSEGKRLRTEAERREIPAAATAGSSSASSGGSVEQVASQTVPVEAQADEPVFGTMSVAGRTREMEDAIFVQTSLCRPEINRRRPVHFFAVYDGHGGTHVSSLCREKMHVIMEEELMRASRRVGSESAGVSTSTRLREHEQLEETQATEGDEGWRRVMTRSFQRMDEVAVSTCACGRVESDCGCQSVEVYLSGSTATVAVLTSELIIVANCGDSRAVLCRGGRAIPLTFDHKPDRPDELARIEAAGGRVIFANGARVEGILAMSRAIGDKYLKPVVIAEPEVTITKWEPEDEFLILASDGLWDVLSSDLACEVACECLREGDPEAVAAVDLSTGCQIEDEGAEVSYPSRSMLAAALLTRLALGRKSSDNISVIVVDLKMSQGTDRQIKKK